MTILEPSEGWTNPFTRPTTPTVGRVVLYHADDEGTVWPAIVSEVRASQEGQIVHVDGATDQVVKMMEDQYGPFSIQAHLTIFRPGAITWKWCVEGTGTANWSWPVIKK